jgi:uncharacterized protein YjbJ (UPF0337 family)
MTKKSDKQKNVGVLVDENAVEENRDPISNEPGAHPVGVAAGGTGGAAAGTAIGAAVAGPIGGLVGAAAGAIAGGLAGKGVAEAINPTEEEQYWREYYKTRPYYRTDVDFESYAPAYRFGWESASRPEFRGKNFEEVEDQLKTEWPSYHSTADFSMFRDATKDAYDRVQNKTQDLDDDSFFDRVRSNWTQFKTSVNAKWSRLTEDEIEETLGRRDHIIDRIQEKYKDIETQTRDQIKRDLNDIARKLFM